MEIVKSDAQESVNNCGTCPHWHFALKTKDGRIGECRVNSPTLHLIPVETLQGVGASLQSRFPSLMEAGWCGQHPARKHAVSMYLALAAQGEIKARG